jgi:hypothetical protein
MTKKTTKRWQLTLDNTEFWQDCTLWERYIDLINLKGVWRDKHSAVAGIRLTKHQKEIFEVITNRELFPGDKLTIEVSTILPVQSARDNHTGETE